MKAQTWTKVLRIPESAQDEPAVVRRPFPTPVPAASETKRSYVSLYGWMALTDAVSVAAGLNLADFLFSGYSIQGSAQWAVSILGMFAAVAIFAAFRLYNAHQLAPAEEFRRIILAVTVTITSVFTLSFWVETSRSRIWILLSWGIAAMVALVSRRLWHYYVYRQRVRGRLSFRTLIIGTNDEAKRVAELMLSDPWGYTPVGFVSAAQGGAPPIKRDDVRVLGGLERLREIVTETGADCLFVAASDVGVRAMGFLSELSRVHNLELRVTSNLPEVLSSRLAVQPIGGMMALSLKPATLTRPQAFAKRVFDLVVASALIALTLPVWILIAVAIKLTSRGPILFTQERVGLRGRPFTLFKFRTMVANAEELRSSLDGENQADGPLFKLQDDPRVTRVGRRLRRWSLDELPQLLNVVRGEMSLVGPRPPLPDEVARYEDRHFERLEVPPGVTGLWQVRGRSNVSFDEYVRLDVFYVENWSLAYDLYILLKTFQAVLSRRGAY